MPMSRKIFLVLGLLWFTSLLVAFMIGRASLADRQPVGPTTVAQNESARDNLGPAAVPSPPEPSTLQTEPMPNDEASNANRKLLNAALKRLLSPPSSTDRPEARMSEDELFQAAALYTSGGYPHEKTPSLFEGVIFDAPGVMEFLQAGAYIAEIARRGDVVIPMLRDFLATLPSDPESIPPEEMAFAVDQHEFAKQLLGVFADPQAFRILLELKPPATSYWNIETQHIVEHVRHLSPEQANELAPSIRDFLRIEMERGNYPGIPDVASQMYFVHGHSEFRSLLSDDRILVENLGGALDAANEAHTLQARDFLQTLAAGHQDDGVRSRALELLDDW